jgi:hypothetical protein
VTERPAALETLDLWLETLRLGHETIFDRHRDLVVLGRDSDHARGLLKESAEIALHQAIAMMSGAQFLAARWREQSVLAPPRADVTLGRLERELDRIRPEIRRLLQRHREIARELRLLLDDG